MLDIREIDGEIARLESGSPNMNDCAKLAVLWSVRNQYWPDESQVRNHSEPLSTPIPDRLETRLGEYGDSDFLLVVSGKVPADAWAVMDDLMDTLRGVNPRVYDSVMRRLKQL